MSDTAKPITELKVTAHMMRLDAGLFCIVQTPSARHAPDAAGLPGVRLALPPNAPAGCSIAGFRADGWMSGAADASVVRVPDGGASLLVTVYQNTASTDPAPRLQVIRLGEDAQHAGAAPAALRAAAAAATQTTANQTTPNQPTPNQPPGRAPAAAAARPRPEVLVHQQVKGDVGGMIGDWIGDRGSKRWIEGFMLVPRVTITSADIEYQAVLGRGWLSPWSEGGNLCGSRGMSLPILGLRVRMKGSAAERWDVSCEATFVDGTKAGAATGGDPCEAESLSPLEAFCITLVERAAATAEPASKPAARAPAAKAPPARVPAAKAPPARRPR